MCNQPRCWDSIRVEPAVDDQDISQRMKGWKGRSLPTSNRNQRAIGCLLIKGSPGITGSWIPRLESQITNQRRYRSWKRKSIVTAGKTWLENPKKWNEERRWKESSRLTFVSLGFCWLMLRLTRSFFYAFMLAVTSGSPSKKPEEKARWKVNTKVKRTSLRPKKTKTKRRWAGKRL